jgi:hypothetical protein
MNCEHCHEDFYIEDSEVFFSSLSDSDVTFNFTCPECNKQMEILYEKY